MKIVISAYDCSPDHGSEAGLGWNWVMAASKYADFDKVHVITTDRYEKNIRGYMEENSDEMKRILFHFLPLPLSGLKKLNQRFKYIIWQWKVGNLTKELCKEEDISFLHHVTWATCVLPTFLYRGGVPFVYGPIGGGERIPQGVDIKMSKRDTFVEWVRNMFADVSAHFPTSELAYKKSRLILTTTEETKSLIPMKYRDKARIMQAIGINDLPDYRPRRNEEEDFIVLLAARMLCWKGIDIAIETFRQLEKIDSSIKLLIAGTGRNQEVYKRMAKNLSNVQFLGEVPHTKMEERYIKADVLLNCSLHDSGCMVVLEAMSYGLPVIAIKAGGPAILTDENCAILIEPTSVKQMTDKICQSILSLKDDNIKRDKMSLYCRERAKSMFMYDLKYRRIVAELNKC